MAYTLKGRKCGTVRFVALNNGTVTAESITRSSKVTSNPIENGADINDHVVKDPEKFAITGVIVGGSGDAAKLKAMWENRDILEYTGRSRISSAVISSYKEDYSSKNARGFGFSITLQKVNITSADYVPMGDTLMSQQDAGASTSGSASTSGGGTQQSGLNTVSSTTVSSNSYSDYVNSYNNKPASSNGPNTRSSPSYNGVA